MERLLKIVSISSAITHATSQFVPPPTGLKQTFGHMGLSVRYKEVPPSVCETTPGVRTLTGYVDIAEDQHLFFWFFEARNQDPTTAPLTIWVDGGPGTPSTSGLFDESGPCSVDSEGNLVYNPYSYNNVTNMLYLDQPVSTGFSYAKAVPAYLSQGNLVQLPDEDCPDWVENHESCGTYSNNNDVTTANSTMTAAVAYWMFLQGFMGAFPQYSSNGFHFFSISYGGHYGPVFNAYTLQQNALIANGALGGTGAHHVDLRSVIIGNGWYDPLVNYAAYYNYTVNPGNTYGLKLLSKHAEDRMYNAMFGPGNCLDQLTQCRNTGRSDVCRDADHFCATEVEYVLDREANRDEYDIREISYTFPYDFYPEYLNQQHILEAIGASVNYSDGSLVIFHTFDDTGDDGRVDNTIQDVRMLVENGVYMVEYAGDADYNCNWLGGEVIAQMTGPASFEEAGYTNIITPDHIIHGQVKQSSNFAFARIYEAGHSVSFYQPLTALEILARVIAGKDIATGTIDVGGHYRTKGPAKSTYQEGDGTVVYHPISLNATYNTTTNRPNPPPAKILRQRGHRFGKRQSNRHKK